MLIILIPHQLLIKVTESLKGLLSPATIRYGIDPPFEANVMKLGPPDRKGGVKSGGDRAPQIGFRLGSSGSSHVVSSGLFEQFDASFDIIRSILGVGIHPDDDVRPGRPNRQIQAGGDNSTWIIDHAHPWVLAPKLFQEFSRAIVRHSIRHDHLKATWQFLLLKYGAQASLNVMNLIPASHHDTCCRFLKGRNV